MVQLSPTLKNILMKFLFKLAKKMQKKLLRSVPNNSRLVVIDNQI